MEADTLMRTANTPFTETWSEENEVNDEEYSR